MECLHDVNSIITPEHYSINDEEGQLVMLGVYEEPKQIEQAEVDAYFQDPDFVNASPTRNSLTHKPQRERDIIKTSRKVMGGAVLSISQRVTQTKIITSDYQVVTAAL